MRSKHIFIYYSFVHICRKWRLVSLSISISIYIFVFILSLSKTYFFFCFFASLLRSFDFVLLIFFFICLFLYLSILSVRKLVTRCVIFSFWYIVYVSLHCIISAEIEVCVNVFMGQWMHITRQPTSILNSLNFIAICVRPHALYMLHSTYDLGPIHRYVVDVH